MMLTISCKKEFYSQKEQPDLQRIKEIQTYKKDVESQIIDFDQFANNINLNNLGVLKDVLSNTKTNIAQKNTSSSEIGSDNFILNKDKIKLLKINGTINYVFSIQPVNSRAITFRNITIQENKNGTTALMTVYTPTKNWIQNWRMGKKIKFEGIIDVSSLDLNSNKILQKPLPTSKTDKISSIKSPIKVSDAVWQCATATVWDEVAYPCGGTLQHWPGEFCEFEGEKAGYKWEYVQKTTCGYIQTDPPPAGGTGDTTPNPPSNYDPCDTSTLPPGTQLPVSTIDDTPCDTTLPQREEKLDEELEDKPDLLLDCDIAKLFKDLASYKPPLSIYNRISDLNAYSNHPSLFSNPYYVQQVKNAAGFQINLDRFEININTLPIVGGHRLSADEFLRYIRNNLNDFIDNSIATFEPYNDPNDLINDQTRWNSNSPLGSILHLDMADNGSVIVSDYAWDHWTVSTLRTPIDGAHPVSGNRTWGYDLRSSGGYTFYVTGADRLTRGSANMLQLLTDIPFTAADNLWESYQTKVTQFVNSHSGNSSIGNKIKERPNYQSVKDYFDGKITLQQLKTLKGCN